MLTPPPKFKMNLHSENFVGEERRLCCTEGGFCQSWLLLLLEHCALSFLQGRWGSRNNEVGVNATYWFALMSQSFCHGHLLMIVMQIWNWIPLRCWAEMKEVPDGKRKPVRLSESMLVEIIVLLLFQSTTNTCNCFVLLGIYKAGNVIEFMKSMSVMINVEALELLWVPVLGKLKTFAVQEMLWETQRLEILLHLTSHHIYCWMHFWDEDEPSGIAVVGEKEEIFCGEGESEEGWRWSGECCAGLGTDLRLWAGRIGSSELEDHLL